MDLNMLIFILLFGLLQGGLMVAVLLSKKKIEAFHIFLCGYISVLLLQLIFKVLNKLWFIHHFIQPYALSYYLPFLYGPLIFLFARSYLRQSNKISFRSLIHFIPFGIYLAIFAMQDTSRFSRSIIRFLISPANRLVFQFISLAIYHALVFSLLNKEPGSHAIFHSRKRFLRRFSIISSIVTIAISITLYFLYTRFPNYQELRWIFALLSVFIYWLSYEALRKPELFRVIAGNMKSPAADYSLPYLKVHHTKEKYAHSSLKDDEGKRILAMLERMMDNEKIFLDPDVNIDRVADKISCRKHHLSQVLNDKMKKSFNDLLNEKRIQEAKVILSDPDFNHFKIASVAFDTGFRSLSSFNDIFKRKEGITPSQYRNSSQQNRSQISRV